MTLDILLKILLMLVDTPGIIAPAETATNPAMRAYSIRSWPWLSAQILNFHTRLMSVFICLLPVLPPPHSNDVPSIQYGKSS
jgi:hypothetical protein